MTKLLASAEWQMPDGKVRLERLHKWLDARAGDHYLSHRIIYNSNLDVVLAIYDAQPGEKEALVQLEMYID